MHLLRERHPEDPVLEMAFTAALLRAVADGSRDEVVRVYRPGAAMAFGRRDTALAGYAEARGAAADAGFAPVVRLGGGHAAAYDEGSVLVEVVTREAGVGVGIEDRFAVVAAVVGDALAAVGLDAVVGELPGEYCPGRWSLHARGSDVKLAGLAQRSLKGAALTTAFVAVQGGDRLRAALVAVYAALGLAWDPATAGAAEDVVPDLRAEDVEAAIVAALSALDAPQRS